MQTALGASRLRLAGTIVSESLVLSFLAGIVGFAATWASLRALVAMAPGGLPRVDAIHMDGGVALFRDGAFTRDDDPFSVGSGVRGGTHRSRVTRSERRPCSDTRDEAWAGGARDRAGGTGRYRCRGRRARCPKLAAAAVHGDGTRRGSHGHGVARITSGSLRGTRAPSPVPRGCCCAARGDTDDCGSHPD